jgi:hypothetical protein
MFRQGDQRRNRKAELGLELLEGRVVLSAGGTGAAAVAAEVARAVQAGRDHPAVASRFASAIDQLNRSYTAHLDRFDRRLSRGIDRFDRMYERAVDRAAARIRNQATPDVPAIERGLLRSARRIETASDRFIANFDARVRRFTVSFNAQFDRVGAHAVRRHTALQPAFTLLQGHFRAAEAAINGTFTRDLLQARATLRSAIAATQAIFGGARVAGLPAARTAFAAADSRLHAALQDPGAASRVHFIQFVSRQNANSGASQSTSAAAPQRLFGPLTPYGYFDVGENGVGGNSGIPGAYDTGENGVGGNSGIPGAYDTGVNGVGGNSGIPIGP